MNTEQLKVDLWQNACLNFCKIFCKILKDKPQGFNNESGLFQDRLNKIKLLFEAQILSLYTDPV